MDMPQRRVGDARIDNIGRHRVDRTDLMDLLG